MADYRSITPAMERELTIKRLIGNCNIAKPCVIKEVKAGNLVNVQPTETIKSSDSQTATYTESPIIEDVPVIYPYAQSQGFSLTVPLSVSDTGLLLFADRALDSFLEQGKPAQLTIDGNDALNACRAHSLTDAIFIPGLCWEGNRINGWASDCVEMRDSGRVHRASVKRDKIEIYAGNDCHATIEDAKITLQKGGTSVIIQDGSIVINAPGGGLTFNGGGTSMGMSGSGFDLDGNFVIKGNVNVTGNITASGDVHGRNI